MNLLWWVIRPLYILGLLIPVLPLFLGFAMDPSDREVASAVIAFSLCYFIIGWVLFGYLPARLRARIMSRVAKHKRNGFKPRWEAVSVIFNRYLGFDVKAQRVLYVDVTEGIERWIDFHDLFEWQLERDNKRTSLLKLMTRVPEMPVIGMRIPNRMNDICHSQLTTIFS